MDYVPIPRGLIQSPRANSSISGVDLLNEIRSCSPVPVIFLTADEQNAAVERAVKQVPSVDALGKPFSPEELSARVRQALNANAP